jgi:Mrp family chromosome partitioning ATPase
MDQTRGKASGCASSNLISNKDLELFEEKLMIEENIRGIDRKILVMSGKGGVGKSSVATNIAIGLSLKGKQVGLMDIDIHGPSIPKMVGLEGAPLRHSEDGLMPIEYSQNLRVMSIGFLISDQKDAVIWRAPLKHSLIKQFLSEVNWGKLDYLIVDCPPGTGDELISIAQLLEGAFGAVIVTTPQDVALIDVRKSISFCHNVALPVLGLVENMSGFVCPHCGITVDIFKSGGGEKMASEIGVPFLGRIPIDSQMVERGDSGKPLLQYAAESKTATAFDAVINTLLN